MSKGGGQHEGEPEVAPDETLKSGSEGQGEQPDNVIEGDFPEDPAIREGIDAAHHALDSVEDVELVDIVVAEVEVLRNTQRVQELRAEWDAMPFEDQVHVVRMDVSTLQRVVESLGPIPFLVLSKNVKAAFWGALLTYGLIQFKTPEHIETPEGAFAFNEEQIEVMENLARNRRIIARVLFRLAQWVVRDGAPGSDRLIDGMNLILRVAERGEDVGRGVREELFRRDMERAEQKVA